MNQTTNNTTKMIPCPACNGVGKHLTLIESKPCLLCEGTGKIPKDIHTLFITLESRLQALSSRSSETKTNENWFCSLPTKEKAKALGHLVFLTVGKVLRSREKDNHWYTQEYWEKWLQAPHKDS